MNPHGFDLACVGPVFDQQDNLLETIRPGGEQRQVKKPTGIAWRERRLPDIFWNAELMLQEASLRIGSMFLIPRILDFRLPKSKVMAPVRLPNRNLLVDMSLSRQLKSN